MGPRGFDRPGHCLTRDTLAETGAGVPNSNRFAVLDDLRCLIGHEVTGREALAVGDEHTDTMAVVPAQISLDQMVRDLTGFFGMAAAGNEDPLRKGTQLVVVNDHVASRKGKAYCANQIFDRISEI
ncbi:hypothetical protein CHELA40_14714 [Chelatococcus asaccharovorans]|nr:hypothetical protein CHELA17_60906 [Chelatococcus asaccharovorans]CAH1679463.1 hypothetical protein CHELA40_14714 [Chelatococcus asaccharovorans]